MYALVDCNNFYASCERLFKPKLIGKPIVVLSNNDGCIIARSSEAKALGIPMGAPFFKAKPLVKKYGIVVFSSNYQLYGDMSARVMHTLQDLAPRVEVYSIDEAFLDVANLPYDLQEYAQHISCITHKHTGIPVTVGIARTKTLAKIATRLVKKKIVSQKGAFYLRPEHEIWALSQTPIGDVWGIGFRLADKLSKQGVTTAYDLTQCSDGFIRKNLTVMGLKTAHELRGTACYDIEEAPPTKKTITVSRSFGNVIDDFQSLSEAMANFASRASEKLHKEQLYTNAIVIHTRTNRFDKHSEYKSHKVICELPHYTNDTRVILRTAKLALQQIYDSKLKYKKAGIYLLHLTDKPDIQHELFNNSPSENDNALMQAIDQANMQHGKNTLFFASQGTKIRMHHQQWRGHSKQTSPCYTTKWGDLLTV